MKALLSIVLIVLGFEAIPQNQIFGKTKSWKLYKLEGNKAFKCPADSLMFMENVLPNADTINIFLQNATAWPKDKYSLWMGSWLASFEDEKGYLHKVDISMYGGFFYDERLKLYYQVSEHEKDKWLRFINYNYQRFSSL